jgi:hypothetical protein
VTAMGICIYKTLFSFAENKAKNNLHGFLCQIDIGEKYEIKPFRILKVKEITIT